MDPANDQADEVPGIGDPDELADPNDLIVGTIGPPGWLARVPAFGWVFIGLAIFDVGYRVWNDVQLGPGGPPPPTVASLILSMVGAGATVLLPTAVAVGFRRPGRAGSWLFQGAAALAVAELFGLVAQDALTAAAGPPSLNSESGSFATDYVVRLFVVQVPVLVLRLFGLAKIGLGLGSVDEPSRPLGRTVWALIVGTLVILLGVGLTLQFLQAEPITDAGLLAYNLFALAALPIVVAMWAWIASIAARRDRPPWKTILTGALAIVLGYGIRALGGVLALERAGTDDALTILTWSGLVASAFGAFGAVTLVVAFARGFEPVEDESSGEVDAEVKDGMADSADQPAEA
jgi:hypothetical protein